MNEMSYWENLNYYQQKIVFSLSRMHFTSNDASQNMFFAT